LSISAAADRNAESAPDGVDVTCGFAQHVGVDVEYINDDLDLSEDLALDLFDVIELMMVLEEIFIDQTVTNEADEIELVGDLIRHIERHQESRRGGLG
jgi:acyl carrier protein